MRDRNGAAGRFLSLKAGSRALGGEQNCPPFYGNTSPLEGLAWPVRTD